MILLWFLTWIAEKIYRNQPLLKNHICRDFSRKYDNVYCLHLQESGHSTVPGISKVQIRENLASPSII